MKCIVACFLSLQAYCTCINSLCPSNRICSTLYFRGRGAEYLFGCNPLWGEWRLFECCVAKIEQNPCDMFLVIVFGALILLKLRFIQVWITQLSGWCIFFSISWKMYHRGCTVFSVVGFVTASFRSCFRGHRLFPCRGRLCRCTAWTGLAVNTATLVLWFYVFK